MNHENVIVTTKSERQELGAERFINSNRNGVLVYVPRFGKTRTALLICKKLYVNKKHSILVIAPNQISLEQWNKELKDYQELNFITLNVYVTTASKISEHLDYVVHYDLIIYDEVHNFLVDSLFPLVTGKCSITSTYKLGLTGTYPIGLKASLLSAYMSIIDFISEEEAITNKWISNFNEFNYKLEFNSAEKVKYIKYSQLIKESLDLFDNFAQFFNAIGFKSENGLRYNFEFKSNYDYLRALSIGKPDKFNSTLYAKKTDIAKMFAYVKGWHRDLDLSTERNRNIDKYWNPQNLLERASNFKYYVEQRNNLINNAPLKLQTIISIVEKFKDKQIIIFVGSTDMANTVNQTLISKGVKSIAYHSKIDSCYLKDENGDFYTYKTGEKAGQNKVFGKDSLRKLAVEGIKSKTFNVLVTVNSMNEALDIPNLELAIIASGTTSTITHTQRTARVKTIEIDKIVACIVNLYFDNFFYEENEIISRDKTKLLNRQQSSKHGIININSLNYVIF